jgi:LacI family transcriptional regulator
MATIKEIARLAGVGVGTVSRVLNGGRNVSRETMEKVLEFTQQLNYKPNKIARSLVKRRYSQPVIGVVVTTEIHPFFYEVLKGIDFGLKQSHFNLMIFNTGDDRGLLCNRVPYENLAGILILSTRMKAEEKRQLKMNGVPFLYLDYYEEGENSIYLDNYAGGELAAAYLLSQNASRIGFMGENIRSQQCERRLAGFQDHLHQRGLNIVCRKLIDVRENMPYGRYEPESYRLTKELLRNTDIDGIFYYCDEFAYGGLNAIAESGKEVAVVGYDDTLPSKYLGLTTVRQPAYQLGLEGTKRMMELIAADAAPVLTQCIRPELLVRTARTVCYSNAAFF